MKGNSRGSCKEGPWGERWVSFLCIGSMGVVDGDQVDCGG